EDVVDRRTMLGQILPAFVRDLVNFLSTLLRDRPRVAEVLEHGQSWVDSARAGDVRPPESPLQLLDDLVAVARLFLEQPQDDVLEVSLLEQAACTALPVASPGP